VRLWIDTDVGTDPDDAVALLCAAAHPDVELVGVSTVDGDTERRAEVARAFVEAPVIPGDVLRAFEVSAVEPEAFLAIGPLPNVARLLASGLVLPRLGVMGGVLRPVRHRGAIREVEHNFGTEPAAAQAVIRHAPAVLLCPLDVTVRMSPSEGDLRQMVEAAPILGPMFDDWVERLRATGIPEGEAGIRLHDPLALLALAGEPFVRIERPAVTVDASGGVREDAGSGRAVEVVTDVDVPRAMERIVSLVAQSARNGQ
jgi:inosine-uridine nucleoside N-ribohydrolase